MRKYLLVKLLIVVFIACSSTQKTFKYQLEIVTSSWFSTSYPKSSKDFLLNHNIASYFSSNTHTYLNDNQTFIELRSLLNFLCKDSLVIHKPTSFSVQTVVILNTNEISDTLGFRFREYFEYNSKIYKFNDELFKLLMPYFPKHLVDDYYKIVSVDSLK